VNSPVLWSPNQEDLDASGMAAFIAHVNQVEGLTLRVGDYTQVHDWSVSHLDDFWARLAEFADVEFSTAPQATLVNDGVEHSTWFPGASLNYAERALAITDATPAESVALIAIREGGPSGQFTSRELTLGELRENVAGAQEGLRRMGVGPGDRVVALVPNCIEAVVAFLATASLGAIWSSCSPEFGPDAVLDRFAQLEPTALIAVDGYRYGGKDFDTKPLVSAIMEKMHTLRGTVVIPYLDSTAEIAGAESWSAFVGDLDLDQVKALTFAQVPFEHPLWVLFSSGTTGSPKGIVHGHGGILLEHFKNLRLHHDLKPGRKFFWYTTTGWMMWNYLVSGLVVGSTVILYDGSPVYPDMRRLWSIVEEFEIDFMGVSAPFIHACMKAGIRPGAEFDLSRLKALGSTGAPLSPEAFVWVADEVGDQIQVCSTSGGTDVCTAFLISAPNLPIWSGELSCAALGVDARSLSDSGENLVGEVGELVLAAPLPSMPVSFWNDPDGSKLHQAYFDFFPGMWRHGDWCVRTDHDSFVLLGRSDATLNRGGVRMGTAEFYRVAEGFEFVLDSLVVDIPVGSASGDGELICFVVLKDGWDLVDCEPKLRSQIRTSLSPRHVPDTFIKVDAIPKTINGKKCEVPVKRILMGADPAAVVNPEMLQDSASLDFFISMAKARSHT
jgi:acetoacetyl-CoA synthetase